ncbi:hypothetical protein QTP88_005888 [Uroleucon formosanum]
MVTGGKETFGGDGETDRMVRSMTVMAVPRSAAWLQDFRRAYHLVVKTRRSISSIKVDGEGEKFPSGGVLVLGIANPLKYVPRSPLTSQTVSSFRQCV